MKNKIDQIKRAPRGFCLAKWYQVTIDLTSGCGHSCHHPDRHEIPLKELEKTPLALHNTSYKMLQRKKMLEGGRPSECKYCWDIEDLNSNNDEKLISDRFIKSTDDWAFDKLDKTLSLAWDSMVTPTYLEIVLSTECNLNCCYCVADISSSIRREMLKHGPYPVRFGHRVPSYVNDENKTAAYVEAFWKFLPMVSGNLKVFRITGGEPMLSKETFKILEYFENYPNPNLELAINTNLSYSHELCEKLLSYVKVLKAKGSISKFSLYISLDSYGDKAAYARQGLNFKTFMNNFRIISNSSPDTPIVIMCTYNILTIFNFSELLHWIEEQKKSKVKISLDVCYLKTPVYLMANIIDKKNLTYALKSLEIMKDSPYFSEYETNKFERIVKWISSAPEFDDEINLCRADFYSFINEYDRRFNSNFLKIFPEASGFYNLCKKFYIVGK